MFSSRTAWQREPNRITQKLRQLREVGREIIDLTISNPTEAGFVYPENQILDALSSNQSLRYAPDSHGLLSAREAVAGHYAARNLNVKPENIFLTASTSEAYAFLFMLLCESGDEVLVPVPSYPLFEYLAQLHNVQIRPYNLGYDGEWHIDLNSVEEGMGPATKAIVLINPHNPTGMFVKNDELESINRLASKNGCALIVDEVFGEYSFEIDDNRVRSTATNDEVLTFTINGISKLCGLPQLKLGWIIASGNEPMRTEALHRLEIISDTFLSVNTPVQAALPRLFELGSGVRQQICTRVKENYSFMQKLLTDKIPMSLLQSEGGWYATLQIPKIKSDEEWVLQLLEEVGVNVFPGYYFEFRDSGLLVLSTLPRKSDFERGVSALLQLMK